MLRAGNIPKAQSMPVSPRAAPMPCELELMMAASSCMQENWQDVLVGPQDRSVPCLHANHLERCWAELEQKTAIWASPESVCSMP